MNFVKVVTLLVILVVYAEAQLVEEDPVDTTVCEGDSATFTCVFFISSGLPTNPQWGRNGAAVDMMRHTVTSNLTGGVTTPVSVSSTVTVSNITLLDDGVSYTCGIGSEVSDGAMLNVVGLPSSLPKGISVTPLSSTSFMITWRASVPDYNYTVIWTNQNTGEMDSYTVQGGENSHIVTGLSDVANYAVSVAVVNMCGNRTSNDPPILVYDPPNEPSFDQCISYDNGQIALQVLSYVDVVTPNMSLLLTFSASYQTGNSGNSSSQSANCSLSNMQYNCLAEFAVGVIAPVDTIETVNVTVSGPYGSASTIKSLNLTVATPILSFGEVVSQTSVMLDCTLPCFSSVECRLFNFSADPGDYSVTNNRIDSMTPYDNPIDRIFISGLMANTMYMYCIHVNDGMRRVDQICDDFKTLRGGGSTRNANDNEPNEGDDNIGAIVGGVVGGVVGIIAVAVVIIIVYIFCCHNKGAVTAGDRQELKSPTTGTMEGRNKPSNVNIPHQTADSGVEYAVTTKAVSKPQQQQPPAQEYAMVDKSKKKNSAANQGIMYADLQAIPSSGNAPSQKQGPTATYAQVA